MKEDRRGWGGRERSGEKYIVQWKQLFKNRNAMGMLKLSHWAGNHSMLFKINVSIIY